MRIWRWLNALPLGMELYFWFWTGADNRRGAVLLAGAVVPGLVVLILLLVSDQAVFFTPSHRGPQPAAAA